VPALVLFMLTILSVLLALFVIIVLHYNTLVSFKGKRPYKLPWMKCCHTVAASEMFFPVCVDEEHIKLKILKDEIKARALEVQEGQAQQPTQMLLPDGYNLDLPSNGSEQELAQSSYETDKGGRRSDAFSDFALDDEIMEDIKRNKQGTL